MVLGDPRSPTELQGPSLAQKKVKAALAEGRGGGARGTGGGWDTTRDFKKYAQGSMEQTPEGLQLPEKISQGRNCELTPLYPARPHSGQLPS